MIVSFYVREKHPLHNVFHKVSVSAGWPGPFAEPADETTAFAQAYAARYEHDADFPDEPIRNSNGLLILPESIDQSPAAYIEANTPHAAADADDAPRYPFSGPANIHRGPATSSATIAAYERGRRGLRKLDVEPPPEPIEAPPAPVSSFTPQMGGVPGPEIPPRVYEPDPNHPKYGRHTGHIAGRRNG